MTLHPPPSNKVATLSDIFDIAKKRWFKVSELEFLLKAETTPLTLSTDIVDVPALSGTLRLFNRKTTRKYKMDGHNWLKKRNSMKVREDHVKLRINGKKRISGFYAHSEDRPALRRRAYYLIDSCNSRTEGNSDDLSDLVLVHYLDTEIAQTLSYNDDEIVLIHDGKKRKRRKPKNLEIDRPTLHSDHEGTTQTCGTHNSFQQGFNMLMDHPNKVFKSYMQKCSLIMPKNSLMPFVNVEKFRMKNDQLEPCTSIDGNDEVLQVCGGRVISSSGAREFSGITDDVPKSILDDSPSQTQASQLITADAPGKTTPFLQCYSSCCETDIIKSTQENVPNETSTSRPCPTHEPSLRSFESDFDILWNHLLKEVGGSVSILTRVAMFSRLFAEDILRGFYDLVNTQ